MSKPSDEKAQRKEELHEALEDAFQSGGKVFDVEFWEEAKKFLRRRHTPEKLDDRVARVRGG